MNTDFAFNVLGSFFGTLTGGLISVWISSRLFKKHNKIQGLINLKERIYAPLYNETNSLLLNLEGKIMYFYPNVSGEPIIQLKLFDEMERDERLLVIEQHIRGELINLRDELKVFNDYMMSVTEDLIDKVPRMYNQDYPYILKKILVNFINNEETESDLEEVLKTHNSDLHDIYEKVDFLRTQKEVLAKYTRVKNALNNTTFILRERLTEINQELKI